MRLGSVKQLGFGTLKEEGALGFKDLRTVPLSFKPEAISQTLNP